MSAAYFFIPHREGSGLDSFVDGKALAHARDSVLDWVCRQTGIDIPNFMAGLVDKFGKRKSESK
jgi:hypothetical protein